MAPLLKSPPSPRQVRQDDPAQVSVRVLLFAGARELAGTAEGVMTGVPADTDEAALLRRVTEAFSLHAMAGSFILALNQDFVAPGDALRLRDGDEVAVIPPLSGG